MKHTKKVKNAIKRKKQDKNGQIVNIKFTLPHNINTKFKKEAKRQNKSYPLLLKDVLEEFFKFSKSQNLFLSHI